jgi:hypothetical protein
MKNFELNDEHDVVIENGKILMAEGTELTRQSAECVLNTKIGEWFLNDDVGIDMNALLGKNFPDDDEMKSIILQGLRQIDETFEITAFKADYDRATRKMKIELAAVTESGETIDLSDIWG